MLLFITSIFIIFSIEIDRISASPSPIAGRPPEDINCPYPNYGIYGNALFSKASSVEWEQKKAFWLTLDIPSRTIVDCMQQCYQYKFCYSIRFLKNAKKSCRLFLHSSDDCKRKLLLSAKKIDQRLEELKADRVIVECLKCMKDEVGIATMSNSEDVPKKTGKGKSPELRLATDDQKDQFLQNDEPIRNSAEAVTRTVKTEPTTDDQREQRQIWRACLVTFEVLPESQKEKALRGINLAKTASVTSLNECAFICYQNACSNILFELSESEEIPSKCHLDIESNKETCSPNLQRHYSYPNNNGTMISCVRCVAHKPTTISPDAEFIPEKTIFTKDNLSFTASTPFSPTILREEPSAETTISEMNNTTPEIRAETDEVTHLIQTIGEAEKKEEDKSSATTTEAPAIEEKIPLLPIIIVNEHEEDGDSTQRPKSVGLAIPSREKSTESTDKPETNESEENTGFTILVQLKNESEVGKMFEGESSQTTEEVDQEQKGIFVGENGGTTAEIEMAVSVSQNEDFGSTTSSSSLISMDSIGLGEASESGLSITTTRIEESMGVETASNGIESKSTPSVSNAVVIAQVMTSSSSPATLSTEPEKTSTIESEKTITSYLSIAGPTPISLNLTGIQEVIVTSTASKTKDEENISNDQTSLSATNAAQFGKSAESITTSPADETTGQVEASASSSAKESGLSPASSNTAKLDEAAGSSSTTSKEATTEIEAISSSIPAESGSSPASPIVVEHEETVGFKRTPSATTQVEATSSSSPAENWSSTAPPADDTTIEFGESSAPLIIAGMQEADAKNANSTSAETTEVISPSNPAEIGSSPAPPIVIEHEETAGSGSTTSTEATTEVEATSSSSPAESGSSQASPIVVQHEETADFNPTPSATTEVEPTSSSNPSEESQDLINAVSNIVDIVKLHSTTTTEHAITTVSDIIDFIEHNISIGDIRQHNPPGFEMRECHGEMLFAGNVLMDYTQSFEIILASETVYECVITCFQLNCTQAAFTHFPRSACLMRFNSNQMPLNSKCSESEELISSWNFKKVPEVVMITCIKCQKEEHLDRGTERILHDELSLDNFRRILDTPHHIINPQGITTKCTGRVEFVIHPVSNLHNLNITNDLPADTPADCARKCFELESCSMAGFIPTPGHESAGGICLITTNFHHNNNCSHNARYTPQYASTLPFLIECIRCTECNYTLSLVDSERATFEYEQSLPVRTISECAKKCSANKCSLAQFDPNKSICSFTASNEIENCQIEAGIQTDGIFPVLLNCVKCVK